MLEICSFEKNVNCGLRLTHDIVEERVAGVGHALSLPVAECVCEARKNCERSSAYLLPPTIPQIA